MKTNVQRKTGILSIFKGGRSGKFRSAPPPGAQQGAGLWMRACRRGVTDSPIERFCGPGGPALRELPLRRKHVLGWLSCLGFVVALLAQVGCGQKNTAIQPGDNSTKPIVFSANYPLHYFVQRISGDAVDTRFLVRISTDGSSTDPAYWVPTSEEVGSMQQADRILLNGAGYEKWLPKVTLAESKLVDTSWGFRDQFITEEAGPSHQHGPGGEHSHGEIAFTTWLDLSLAIQQARVVERTLVRLSPHQAVQFSANFTSLTNGLAALDKELLAWGKSMNGQPLIASHPVYQYFARRYGLNLKSVHWEPDEVPDEAAWQELEAMLKDHPAKWMIWEDEPRDEVVERLKRLGVGSVVVSPCGNPSPPVEFLKAMKQNVVRLKSMEGVDLATP